MPAGIRETLELGHRRLLEAGVDTQHVYHRADGTRILPAIREINGQTCIRTCSLDDNIVYIHKALDTGTWKEAVAQWLVFFEGLPFWLGIEVGAFPELREALRSCGFTMDAEPMGGLVGKPFKERQFNSPDGDAVLAKAVTERGLPRGCSLVRVTDENTLFQFNEFIATIFLSITEATKKTNLALFRHPDWTHVAIKNAEGSIVAARSSLYNKETGIMSFWNGATAEGVYRKKGLSTLLAEYLLHDAQLKGATMWCSFLNGTREAKRLLESLGGEEYCAYDCFSSPT